MKENTKAAIAGTIGGAIIGVAIGNPIAIAIPAAAVGAYGAKCVADAIERRKGRK
jgi:hypothetical protein